VCLEEVVACLCNILRGDPDFRVRCQAAESLGEYSCRDAINALRRAADGDERDENAEVRIASVKALGKIGKNRVSGDRIINTGGGSYYESIDTGGGNYIQGDYLHMSQDLTQAAAQIQDLLEQLQKQGKTVNIAQNRVAEDLANQAQNNPTVRDKLVKWGQSLGDATVTDVVKGVVKLALRAAGIPIS